MNKKRTEYELNKEIEQAENYSLAEDCTMYETKGQYDAYIDGLNFALSSVNHKSDIKKSDILSEIRDCLDVWELQVSEIGNECAFTDRILDKLPALVEKLTKITEDDAALSSLHKSEDERDENWGEEICPHCDHVNDFVWEEGMPRRIKCKKCGNEILLCSLCNMDKVECSKCPYDNN